MNNAAQSGSDHAISSKRPRILFVTENLPQPVQGGSSQRTNLLIDYISKSGQCDIAVIGPPESQAFLEGHGYKVVGVFDPHRVRFRRIMNLFGRRLGGKLFSLASLLFPTLVRYRADTRLAQELLNLFSQGQYDIAIGRYIGPPVRAGLGRLKPAILDIDDLDSQKVESWAKSSSLRRRWLWPILCLPVRHMARVEKECLRQFSRLWLSAQDDVTALGLERTDVIPNIPFQPEKRLPPSDDGGTVLFVASFTYRVNITALERLIHVIWPIVRQAGRPLRLRIVGTGLSASQQASFSAPDIEIAGFIDNLEDEYRRSIFSIVPIWEGGGTKIKIAESLAYGRTCVVASPSMRGYSAFLKNGDALLEAATDQSFAAAVLHLSAERELRHKLEKTGFDKATAVLSRASCEKKVMTAIAGVLAAEPAKSNGVDR